MTNQLQKVHHVAIAILYRENKFLMQLRDNIPTIPYPGYWAFFGGHIESGETPEVDMRSEEHTSELQSQFRISYAVFCLKKKKTKKNKNKKKKKHTD